MRRPLPLEQQKVRVWTVGVIITKVSLKFHHTEDTKCFFTFMLDKDVSQRDRVAWCSLGLISRIYNWKTINTAQVSYWANYLLQPRVWIESAFSGLFSGLDKPATHWRMNAHTLLTVHQCLNAKLMRLVHFLSGRLEGGPCPSEPTVFANQA